MIGRLFVQFRNWERPTQVAFVLAVLLLIVVAVMYAVGPVDLRQPAAIGFFGLLIILQGILLWANRGMVTPYTQAQRAYLAGDFATAAALLEAQHSKGKANVRELTLLGNTYRQQGRLDKSLAILEEAVELNPNHHFSLYGFGRTLMVLGRYAEAGAVFNRAYEAGAPDIIKLDLGEAYYRQGIHPLAIEWLEAAQSVVTEPHQVLMLNYLAYCLGQQLSLDAEMLQNGMPYWEASVERFLHTSYGQVLAEDVRAMQLMVQEG